MSEGGVEHIRCQAPSWRLEAAGELAFFELSFANDVTIHFSAISLHLTDILIMPAGWSPA